MGGTVFRGRESLIGDDRPGRPAACDVGHRDRLEVVPSARGLTVFKRPFSLSMNPMEKESFVKRTPWPWILGLGFCACSDVTSDVGRGGDRSEPIATPTDAAFSTENSTRRFLTQATFGPRPQDVKQWAGRSAAAWFEAQLRESPSLLLPSVRQARATFAELDDDEADFLIYESVTEGFWRNSLTGSDQLRQRMAWALSQVFVVSNDGGETLADFPEAVAYFEDILIRGAFGNYRDLLEEVTYAPAMAYYLTYIGNQKANPETGQQPDENYAREIMQLFSIGVQELDLDGQPVTREGRTETYTNADITGLARVFTGLDYAEDEVLDEHDGAIWARRLQVYATDHSQREKTFLGTTIPPGTPGQESIRIALDTIAAHPNVGPFLGRQLIQRFVTSHPDPAYVRRVAQAFNSGIYHLPNGTAVGTGRRGDLAATLAAVLFDEQARGETHRTEPNFGKLREPVIRLANFFRAFEVGTVDPLAFGLLLDLSPPRLLSQHPYRANSVFNFYRPGYVAPGTRSGQAGLTAPELQLVNASTVPGYANTMFSTIFREVDEYGPNDFGLDPQRVRRAFQPDFSALQSMGTDALIDELDGRLTYGKMSIPTRRTLRTVLEAPDDELDVDERIRLAIWVVVTSADFIVQR